MITSLGYVLVCHLFPGTFNIHRSHISVKFHFTDLAPCRPSRAACPSNRTLNNKINKLHERALKLVYKNDDLSFQELLDADLSETIQEKNLKRLAIEMFKVKIKIAPLPIQELFAEHISLHDLRKKEVLGCIQSKYSVLWY